MPLGVTQVRVSLTQLPRLIRERAQSRYTAAVTAIRETVKNDGIQLVQAEIDQHQPYPPIDRMAYRNGWRVRETIGGANISNSVPYSRIIEGGRMPGGRPPPAEVLGDWAERKGILKGVRNKYRAAAKRSIGFVLARKIAERGLPAKKILSRTYDILRRKVYDAVYKVIR